MTADAVIRGIRGADSDGSIGLAGAETERPYNRSPLSKGLWKGKAMDSIWRGTDATDAALHVGRTVVQSGSSEPKGGRQIITWTNRSFGKGALWRKRCRNWEQFMARLTSACDSLFVQWRRLFIFSGDSGAAPLAKRAAPSFQHYGNTRARM